MMRILDWDGLRNLRDLGGLPTATGVTRYGRVARGPRRELLTSAGWRAAVDWGLRTVVDLRNTEETGRRPADPDAEIPSLTVLRAPTEDQLAPEFRATCLPILDSPEYWQHNVRILPKLIHSALLTIAGAQPGILVHCAAGRDRTGMVSALLLANAGVAGEEIVADYSASVRAMAGTAGQPGALQDRQASWSPEQVEDWLSAVTPFVTAFVSDVNALFEALQVSPSTRARLSALLTD